VSDGTGRSASSSGLRIPNDDGAAAHLFGLSFRDLRLQSTAGGMGRLSRLESKTVVYVHPMTGRPGLSLPDGWDAAPGARGCTSEAGGFRDHHGESSAPGVGVYGLSSPSTKEQKEAVLRLPLPYALLSDEHLQTAAALHLPTFEAGGRPVQALDARGGGGRIDHVFFYPVVPSDRHTEQVLTWLRGRRSA
jgi:peroxiredoxin